MDASQRVEEDEEEEEEALLITFLTFSSSDCCCCCFVFIIADVRGEAEMGGGGECFPSWEFGLPRRAARRSGR